MAWKLLVGYYKCSSGHDHTSADQVAQCNQLKDDRGERHRPLAQQREVEMKRMEMKKEKIMKDRDHDFKMEQLRIEGMKLKDLAKKSKRT